MAVNGGTAHGHSFSQHGLGLIDNPSALRTSETARRPAGTYRCPKEDLTGVDITDAGDIALVQEELLDRGDPLACSGEEVRRCEELLKRLRAHGLYAWWQPLPMALE